MDIHKERKKKRKKLEKKKSSQSGSTENENRKCNSPTAEGKDEEGVGGNGAVSARRGKYDKHKIGNTKPPEGKDANHGGVAKVKNKGKENGITSQNLSKEEHQQAENGKGQQKQKKNDGQSQTDCGKRTNREPSNGDVHLQSTPPPPPPGLGPPNQAISESHSTTIPTPVQPESQICMHPSPSSTTDPSQMSLNDSPDTLQQPEAHSTDERPALSSGSSIQPPLLPPPDALFIIVPRNERPESLPGQPEISIAVPAARAFIRKYYAHFDMSLPTAPIGDLVRYYTSKAQKSVSIGGAHSVVTGRGDIATQIFSLEGTAFIVRGVVAQDTADGEGVHILVTGTARTSLNGAPGGVLANFAHSISLVPIKDAGISTIREALEVGYPFQIHNDALALLSGDTVVAAPTSVPQPIKQHPLLRPPGLF